MSRYIDAEKLIGRLKKDPLYPLVERYRIIRVIEAEPTADVVEIKHGHWIAYGLEDGFAIERYICSECGYDVGVRATSYCPNCGALMVNDEVEE